MRDLLAGELANFSTDNVLGKTILVPLTNSLYVPGELVDVQNIILDVGTGYYVEKVASIVTRKLR